MVAETITYWPVPSSTGAVKVVMVAKDDPDKYMTLAVMGLMQVISLQIEGIPITLEQEMNGVRLAGQIGLKSNKLHLDNVNSKLTMMTSTKTSSPITTGIELNREPNP